MIFKAIEYIYLPIFSKLINKILKKLKRGPRGDKEREKKGRVLTFSYVAASFVVSEPGCGVVLLTW